MTPRKPDKPVLWIVAGPNGSGKSSLYNRTDIDGWGGSVWIINPDLLTAKIVEHEGLALNDANLQAVVRVEEWLNTSNNAYQTIGVETVLSSSKYQSLVQRAHTRGFSVRMIYVVLDSAELQAQRIAVRVSEGGHDVPVDKIAARRRRSFEQLAWFFKNVDQCYIFNNSVGDPMLAGEKLHGQVFRSSPLPADLTATLLDAGIEIIDDPWI